MFLGGAWACSGQCRSSRLRSLPCSPTKPASDPQDPAGCQAPRQPAGSFRVRPCASGSRTAHLEFVRRAREGQRAARAGLRPRSAPSAAAPDGACAPVGRSRARRQEDTRRPTGTQAHRYQICKTCRNSRGSPWVWPRGILCCSGRGASQRKAVAALRCSLGLPGFAAAEAVRLEGATLCAIGWPGP